MAMLVVKQSAKAHGPLVMCTLEHHNYGSEIRAQNFVHTISPVARRYYMY